MMLFESFDNEQNHIILQICRNYLKTLDSDTIAHVVRNKNLYIEKIYIGYLFCKSVVAKFSVYMKNEEQFDPYGIPKEICTTTVPLIGMTGLDIKRKKSHRAIWETFTMNRRSDRLPLKFILLSSDNLEFPTMKQKRQSYEWYIPKGILKTNWVNKYLDSIPSLLVLFWDLDWNDPNWSNEKTNIATVIQSMRLSLGGRNTRIAAVLIQSNSTPVPVPGEDGSGASEKAAALCASCDLPPKQLFVLPHTDSHLLGYTMRLENALSEISGGFYLGEIKKIKAHKDFLNKTNHQLLFIRHQFKIAFHNEMRSDPQTAIKHYSQCYHYLLDHRVTNTNLHEIRTVAAFVNYKICKLDFILNLPRDAIEQFRKHIEIFRARTGPKELIFEHYAWLAKQYSIFADVFEEAVREGLPAVQTQHPGFYYQQAAQYAVNRRSTALQVCKDVTSPEENLLEGWETLEFYGQRPWRPGKHSLEPPEMNTEMEGMKAVCYYELNKVDHSSMIIPFFSSAITQFKKYRCPRIKRSLMVQMAKEYSHAQDASKSLTLLNHVMWDYRSERWWDLLSSCSALALSCAYQVASVQEYLGLCLEILGPRIRASVEEKSAAFKNLIKIINQEGPNPPSDLSEDVIAIASSSWSYNLQTSRDTIVVSMNDILPCLEVRAGFTVSESPVDLGVEVKVKIRNHLEEHLQLFMLVIQTDSSSNAQLREADSSKLELPSKGILDLGLLYYPLIQDVTKTIKITGVLVRLGTSPDKAITLQWSGVGDEGVTVHTGSTPTLKEFGSIIPNPFNTSNLRPDIKIISRKPKIEAKIIYDECGLVWEWLPVTVQITNNELATISDISVSLNLEPKTEISLERTTQIKTAMNFENKLISSSVSNYPIPNIAAGEVASCKFYIKTLTAAKRVFSFKVHYKCEIDMMKRTVVCPTEYASSFSVTSKIPFQITVEVHSMQFTPLTNVAKGERFLVVPKIKCSSHVPIKFTNSSIVTGSHISSEGENQSQVSEVELGEGEWATDCFCVSAGKDAPTANPLSLGQYLLYWKRADEEATAVSVSIGLPSVVVEDWGIWVDVDLPPQGTVRTPLTIAYEIKNTSDHVQELSVSMHVSDAFMFSGHKEIRLRILPEWHECITFTLYPLLAGYVQLPRLTITMETSLTATNSESLDDFILRILPSHLFIMPQEKLKKILKGNEPSNIVSVK